ncbi:MAG: transcription termination/antitermination protein NusA [Chloroflexota bacterium]|nr:transcription termination/antitermination protein NusA [Chloroflexota bacterium]
MSRDFIGALLQLNAEKGVSREQLVRTVEEAIQSAYRRVEPGNEDVNVSLDIETGKMRVYRAKTAVAEVEDPFVEFTLDEAKKYKPEARLGDLVETEELDGSTFGRIHAQTAKQVVLQRLREAEREVVFSQFADRESEIITGTVSRVEPRGVILEMGKAEAILATTDQSATEHYRIGQHVKAFVLEVRRTTRGPLIYVSRTHKNFLRRLFELEVPEIHAGTVEIKAIAREAGSRSKVAVASRQEGLDPVGATVGQRGGRVQSVVAELGGEKIDIIPWNEDPAVFVANALQPATVVKVDIDEEARIASVTVPERMLSLAIGREGQNARLAAKLTGWRIDIRSDQAPAREGGPAERPGRPARAERDTPAEATPAAEAPQDAEASRIGDDMPGVAEAIAAGAAEAEAAAAGASTGASAADASTNDDAAEPVAAKPKRTRKTAATTADAASAAAAQADGSAAAAEPAPAGEAATETAADAPAETKPATRTRAAARSKSAAASTDEVDATAVPVVAASTDGEKPAAPKRARRPKAEVAS